MTDYDLFGATAGPATSALDGSNQYTLGVEFSLTGVNPLWLKGYRFWRAPDLEVTGPVVARAYAAVAETAVASSDASFALSGSGWQTALLATPIPLVLGTRYRAGVHFPNGRYAFTNAYWASSVIVGPLTGHSQASSTAGEQGSLQAGASLAFPGNGSPGAANYWITPIITDVDPGSGDFRTGSVSAPLGLAADLLGVKGSARAVTGVLALAGSPLGAKGSAGAASAGLSMIGSVTGGDVGYLPAAVSDVLCSAWATPGDVPDRLKTELGITDAQLLDPLMRASEMLWALSGRRWYGEGCNEQSTLTSYREASEYHDSWGSCGCWDVAPGMPYAHADRPRSIRLARSPASVVSVTVAGEVLTPTAYRLTRSGWLERVDGGLWDTCAGDTVVVYTFGEPPPRGGRDAAVTLGLELAKDFYDVGKCRLPKRTISVTRQGVSLQMVDPMDFLERGGVGITSVDLWLNAVNPGARTQRATVWSPDLPATHRRTRL